jgi:hypothetical protein
MPRTKRAIHGPFGLVYSGQRWANRDHDDTQVSVGAARNTLDSN